MQYHDNLLGLLFLYFNLLDVTVNYLLSAVDVSNNKLSAISSRREHCCLVSAVDVNFDDLSAVDVSIDTLFGISSM